MKIEYLNTIDFLYFELIENNFNVKFYLNSNFNNFKKSVYDALIFIENENNFRYLSKKDLNLLFKIFCIIKYSNFLYTYNNFLLNFCILNNLNKSNLNKLEKLHKLTFN